MPRHKNPRHPKPSLYELTPAEVESFFLSIGEKPYRSKQLLEHLYHHPAKSFDEMTTFPKPLRKRLSDVTSLTPLTLRTTVQANDGSVKHAYEVAGASGDLLLESVWMPAEKTDLGPITDGSPKSDILSLSKQRHTICISSQLGCAVGCSFCATGKAGLISQISTGAIIYQVVHARILYGAWPDTVLFMGMGEPMHNFESVCAAVGILTHPDAVAMSPRRIVVSTSGELERLGRFHERFPGVRLAISLNAASDSVRTSLIPLNKTFNLKAIHSFISSANLKHGEKITLEYVLLAGINDRAVDIKALHAFLRPLAARIKVNLIPFNPVESIGYKAPELKNVRLIQESLRNIGIMVFIRKNRGRGVSAACGQLSGAL